MQDPRPVFQTPHFEAVPFTPGLYILRYKDEKNFAYPKSFPDAAAKAAVEIAETIYRQGMRRGVAEMAKGITEALPDLKDIVIDSLPECGPAAVEIDNDEPVNVS